MRNLQLLSLAVFVTAFLGPVGAVRHIVFIVADDLGWNDVGFHNPDMITPNIDKLAAGGVILNSSYMQPTCTPSRHAFMTGIYPFKAGMQRGALIAQQPDCSPVDVRFLSERLKTLNYSTHIVGKWHLGYCNWSCTPTYRGFDSFYGFYNGMEDYYTKAILDGTDFRDGVMATTSYKYSTEAFSDRAVDIINKQDRNVPLFLYLPFQSVHAPVEVPKKYEDMYPTIEDEHRRKYCGMVTAMDEGIGRIRQALEHTGLMNDTLIIFTSDNGGMPLQGGNNFPLRGAKTTVYEGGTRVSGFVYGSGLQNSGYTYDGMIHAVDWNPTIISAAGGEMPANIDGINQWDAISTGSPSRRTEFIYNLDPAVFAPTGHSAIRVGDFKLVQGFPGLFPGWYKPPEGNGTDDKFCYTRKEILLINRPYLYEELFNLQDDPNEHQDVSRNHPDIVKQLRDKLDEYRKDMVIPKDAQNDPAADPSKWGGYWSPGWC